MPIKISSSFDRVKVSAPIGKNYRMFDPLTMSDTHIWEDLIENASEIRVWDPFFSSQEDHEFFRAVKTQEVGIEILTLNPSDLGYDFNELKKEARKLRKNIIKILSDNNVKPDSVIIRGIDQINNSERKHGFTTWHDRFLLTDQGVYLLGTSMSSQLAGKKLYGIHKLEYSEDEAVIKYYYEKFRDLSQNRTYGFCIDK